MILILHDKTRELSKNIKSMWTHLRCQANEVHPLVAFYISVALEEKKLENIHIWFHIRKNFVAFFPIQGCKFPLQCTKIPLSFLFVFSQYRIYKLRQN